MISWHWEFSIGVREMERIMILLLSIMLTAGTVAKATNRSEEALGNHHGNHFYHSHMHDVMERMDHMEEKLDSATCKLDKQQAELTEKLRSYEAQLLSHDKVFEAKLEVLTLQIERIIRNEMRSRLSTKVECAQPATTPQQTEQSSNAKHEDWITIFSARAGDRVNISEEWDNVYKWSIEGFKSLVTQLKVSMRSGAVVQYVTFNVTLLSSTGWFRPMNVIQSSYEDLTSETEYNIFQAGTNALQRLFYISKTHAGCNKDSGWMVVVGRDNCAWERRGSETFPLARFMICPGSTYCNWHNEGILAEVFTIEAMLKH